jgi:hypothetical protein
MLIVRPTRISAKIGRIMIAGSKESNGIGNDPSLRGFQNARRTTYSRTWQGRLPLLGLVSSLVCLTVGGQAPNALPTRGASHVWGRLANPDFEENRIKATLFFPGQARDGTSPYGCPITDQLGLYTVHSQDNRHLAWSVSVGNRQFVLDQMVQAGVNVVQMSVWGEDFLPCSTSWAAYSPMQDAPQAQSELFTAAVGRPLLILPLIESRGDWVMRAEFPRWTDGRVAPGVVSQIRNLIQRFLQDPLHPEWVQKWARMYDRLGNPRYAVALIHAASDRLGTNDHLAFASGFDELAKTVENATGVKVGFWLDPLPPGTYAPGVFRPSPELTGPFLAKTESILGISSFIPEIWVGSSQTTTLLAWKRDSIRRWLQTGLPVLMDISAGYDAHLVFGNKAAPSYGYTADWRNGLAAMVADFSAVGMTYNSWNGYTEGMAAVPTLEHGAIFYDWLAGLPPFAVPGKIEAELFDGGGEGISYHDQTPGNDGGAFRSTDVDLEPCTDIGGGYNIGWLGAGEWLRYEVNVTSNALYTIEARVASFGPGGTFHLEFEKDRQTVPFAIPQTGGWQNWVTLRRGRVALSSGQQTLKIIMDQNGSSSVFVGNLNYLFIRPSPHILRCTLSHASLVLTCSAVEGYTYCLEYSDVLGTPWRQSPASCVTAQSNIVTLSTLEPGDLKQHFFRVVERP